jgi:hypothetical protein
MWFPPNELLNEQNETSAFFLLTWQELFDHYVPDIYQPRFIDTFSLIEELSDIARRVRQLNLKTNI